jgi:hypothetical protein
LKQGFLYDLAAVMDSIERQEQRKGRPVKTSGKSEVALREQPKAERSSAAPHTVSCPSCQSPNPAGNRFCGKCGKPLSE